MAKIDHSLIVPYAREWMGTPYHHQEALKGVGCDCIGLIRGVYHELTGIMPPVFNYSRDWGDADGNEAIIAAGFQYLVPVETGDRRPGDVLAVRWKASRVAKHTLFQSYNGRAIHAIEGAVVSEIDLSSWWVRRIAQVFRFPEEV